MKNGDFLKNVIFPFELCSRYSGCSVNNCPLDPVYPNRSIHPEDSDKKCTIAKSYRARIAEQFPSLLKFEGLTQREVANRQRWENMPEAEKQARIQRIKEINAKRWGTSGH